MILQNIAIIFISAFCCYSEYMYFSKFENISSVVLFVALNFIKYLLYPLFYGNFLYFILFELITLLLSRKLFHSLLITGLFFVISYARYPILRTVMQDRFNDIMFKNNGQTANLYIFVLSALVIFTACQIMRKQKFLLLRSLSDCCRVRKPMAEYPACFPGKRYRSTPNTRKMPLLR